MSFLFGYSIGKSNLTQLVLCVAVVMFLDCVQPSPTLNNKQSSKYRTYNFHCPGGSCGNNFDVSGTNNSIGNVNTRPQSGIQTQGSKNCPEYHAVFMVSRAINGKQFMVPRRKGDKQGTWGDSYSFCDRHCADMVTLHSESEKNVFNDFLKNEAKAHSEVWLGGRFSHLKSAADFDRNNPFVWVNGDKYVYSDIGFDIGYPVYNHDEINPWVCLEHWTVTNKMYNKPCKAIHHYTIVCQAYVAA